MPEQTWWETTKVQGGELIEKVKQVIHEGNVRRVVIRQGDRTIAEFPLTAGVVGAVFAPMLAAVGALAALLTDCSIAVLRERVAEGEVSRAAATEATAATESTTRDPPVPDEAVTH